MRQTGIFQGGWEAARQWVHGGHFLVYVFKIMLKVLDLSVLEHIFFAVLLKRVKRGPLLPRSFLATLLILERFRTPGTIWWQGFALLRPWHIILWASIVTTNAAISAVVFSKIQTPKNYQFPWIQSNNLLYCQSMKSNNQKFLDAGIQDISTSISIVIKVE